METVSDTRHSFQCNGDIQVVNMNTYDNLKFSLFVIPLTCMTFCAEAYCLRVNSSSKRFFYTHDAV